MTIDEAIKFCYEKAKNIKLKAEPQVFVYIAEYLKAIKSGEFTDNLFDMGYAKGFNDGCAKFSVGQDYEAGYNKAIDNFVKAIIDRGLSSNDDNYCITHYDNYLKVIKEIAEKLKAGVENENFQ